MVPVAGRGHYPLSGWGDIVRLKALKTGKFAHFDPTKPPYELTELCHLEVDEKTAKNMIDAKWAMIPDDGLIIYPDKDYEK